MSFALLQFREQALQQYLVTELPYLRWFRGSYVLCSSLLRSGTYPASTHTSRSLPQLFNSGFHTERCLQYVHTTAVTTNARKDRTTNTHAHVHPQHEHAFIICLSTQPKLCRPRLCWASEVTQLVGRAQPIMSIYPAQPTVEIHVLSPRGRYLDRDRPCSRIWGIM